MPDLYDVAAVRPILSEYGNIAPRHIDGDVSGNSCTTRSVLLVLETYSTRQRLFVPGFGVSGVPGLSGLSSPLGGSGFSGCSGVSGLSGVNVVLDGSPQDVKRRDTERINERKAVVLIILSCLMQSYEVPQKMIVTITWLSVPLLLIFVRGHIASTVKIGYVCH